MMRGFITESDFDQVDECFPGIVRYYRELQNKPQTFLELLWGFLNQGCGCVEVVPVAPQSASRAVAR